MSDLDLLSLLNTIEFPRLYWELCDRFPIRASCGRDSGWKEAILTAFGEVDIVPAYHSNDRSFICEQEQIGDIVWSGVLCKQRYGLELLFGGESKDTHLGSNFAVLAYDAKRLAYPAYMRDRFIGPPPYPRPAYNGDLAALMEIVKEFVALIRLIKDVIRRADTR
jgi:hypothetical protein